MIKDKNRRNRKPRARHDRSATPGRGLCSMLVEACPDALIALDAAEKILYWSAGAETVYGYSKDEALGIKFGNLIAVGDEISEVEKLFQNTVEDGSVVREAVHRKKDGSTIDVGITAKAVRNEDGNLEYIAASHKDLTQLKILSLARFRTTAAGFS